MILTGTEGSTWYLQARRGVHGTYRRGGEYMVLTGVEGST